MVAPQEADFLKRTSKRRSVGQRRFKTSPNYAELYGANKKMVQTIGGGGLEGSPAAIVCVVGEERGQSWQALKATTGRSLPLGGGRRLLVARALRGEKTSKQMFRCQLNSLMLSPQDEKCGQQASMSPQAGRRGIGKRPYKIHPLA